MQERVDIVRSSFGSGGLVTKKVQQHDYNALYLLSALCMIFMTLGVAVQPLFLRNVLEIPFAQAGAINANVQVVTEILDLFAVGYLGYLSDRVGRARIIVWGFLVAAVGAVIAPSSAWFGVGAGGALAVYYFSRVIMSLGTCAVWPQLSAVAGDFSDAASRTRMMSNTVFMMAFGVSLVYAVLMQIPSHAGVVFTMILAALVALAGAWLSSLILADVAPLSQNRSVPWKRIYSLIRAEPHLQLAFASSLFSRSDMVFVGLFLMLWFLYFADVLGVSQEEAASRAGLLIGLMGGVVLVAIPLWKLFIDKFGRIWAVAVGTAMSALGFAAMGFVVNPFDWFILFPVLLFAAGQAGCFIAPQIIIVDHAPPDMLGAVLGAFNVTAGIGIIFFVQVGGFLFDIGGPPAPFLLSGMANFVVTILCVWVIYGKARQSSKVHAV